MELLDYTTILRESVLNGRFSLLTFINDSLGAFDLQSINDQVLYSEKTTSTSGIIWKNGKTIIFQKCFKALSDMQHGDIICTLPYNCYWTYMTANYNNMAFNALIYDNGKDVLVDKMNITKDEFFFVCGIVVIK